MLEIEHFYFLSVWIFKCGIEAHDEKFSSLDQLFSHDLIVVNANKFLGHMIGPQHLKDTPYYLNLMEPTAQLPPNSSKCSFCTFTPPFSDIL